MKLNLLDSDKFGKEQPSSLSTETFDACHYLKAYSLWIISQNSFTFNLFIEKVHPENAISFVCKNVSLETC